MIQTDPNGGSLKCYHRCAQILSNPSIVIFIREIVQPTALGRCTCWGFGQEKSNFPPENCRELKVESGKKEKIAAIWTTTVTCRRCTIYNYAPRGPVKSFLICWTKYFPCNVYCIFSPLHISDKLVSITSFRASPLSLLDVRSSKEKAAAKAHCAGQYLVSGAGDIMSDVSPGGEWRERQPIRAKPQH